MVHETPKNTPPILKPIDGAKMELDTILTADGAPAARTPIDSTPGKARTWLVLLDNPAKEDKDTNMLTNRVGSVGENAGISTELLALLHTKIEALECAVERSEKHIKRLVHRVKQLEEICQSKCSTPPTPFDESKHFVFP